MNSRVSLKRFSVLLMILVLAVTSVMPVQAAKRKTTNYNAAAYAAVFQTDYYKAANPDLANAGLTTEQQLINHFVNYGMAEGRQASAEFNVQAYKNRYPDLQAAFGNDLKSYYLHYISTGKAEGRDGKVAATTTQSTAATNTTVTTATTNTTASTTTGTTTHITGNQVYNAMIAYKSSYPEGTKWDNSNYYRWKGGIYSGGYGCAGFAFMLSDAAFGSLPARKITSVSELRVGDIVRINNDTHSVIILSFTNNGIVVAEGNYNGSVHWEREIPWKGLDFTYALTRYPE